MAVSAGEIEILIKLRDELSKQIVEAQRAAEKAMGGMADAAKPVAEANRSLLESLRPLAGAVGIAFGVREVVQFGKALLTDADALVKMSDQTGIAIESLGRLEYIAGQSGNTLSEVTGAIGMLQRRLGSGNEGATGALKKLGIEFTDLMRLAPDQQFLAIAREVAKIHDPMERTTLATELFGRAGANVLPTLIADVERLGREAPRMSDKATRAFDALGDAISRAWTTGRIAIGEGVAAAIDGYSRLSQVSGALMTGSFGEIPHILADTADVQLPKLPPALNAVTNATSGVALSMDGMDNAARDLNESIAENARKAREAARAAEEAEDFQARWTDSLNRGRQELIQMDIWLTKFNAGLAVDHDELVKVADRLNKVNDEFRASTRDISGALVPLKETVKEYEQAEIETKKFEDSLGELAQAFAQMAQVSDGALGRVAGAIGRVLTSLDTGIRSFRTFQQGMERGFSFEGIAQMATGIVGMIGSVANLFRGWFGVSEEVKKARTEVEAFQASLRASMTPQQALEAAGRNWAATVITVRDAYLATGRSAAEAEAIVLRLWDTDHPDRAREAIERINEVLAEQQSDVERLEGAMERYGISWEQLGEAARNARLHELGNEIIQDFTVLVNAGADAEFVIEKMGEAINSFVQSALRTGGEVPAAMRPMIERMIDMGLLTDENGEKLTDLTRINFAESLTQGFDRVVDRLNEILRALGWEIPGAAADLNQALHNTDWEGWAQRGVDAAGQVEQSVNDVIQMHSPTGLEGIIFYAGLAGDALTDFASKGVNEIKRVGYSVIDVVKEMEVFKDALSFQREGALSEQTLRQIDEVTARIDDLRRQRGMDSPAIASVKAQMDALRNDPALTVLQRNLEDLRTAAGRTDDPNERARIEAQIDVAEDEIRARKRANEDRDAALRLELDNLEQQQEVRRQQLQTAIETLEAQREVLRNTKNPLEGFARVPEILQAQQAMERVNAVFQNYLGRSATSEEFLDLAKKYTNNPNLTLGQLGGISVSKDRLDAFLKKLVERALEMQFEGFSGGTHGQLVDFGRESIVKLHGRERIQTEAEVRREQSGGGASNEQVVRLLRDLPRAMRVAMEDAVALAPRRA